MRTIYVCWVDDVPSYVDSFDGIIEVMEAEFDVRFNVDKHYSTRDLDSIARVFDDDLFFLIDYNLKGSEGNEMDGHELIALIREKNASCPIIFYSSNATQEHLRKLVGGISYVKCTQRENLQQLLSEIASGSINFTI